MLLETDLRPGVSFHKGQLVSGVVLQKLVGQFDQVFSDGQQGITHWFQKEVKLYVRL